MRVEHRQRKIAAGIRPAQPTSSRTPYPSTTRSIQSWQLKCPLSPSG